MGLADVAQTSWTNNIGMEAGGQVTAQVALATCTAAAETQLSWHTDIYI